MEDQKKIIIFYIGKDEVFYEGIKEEFENVFGKESVRVRKEFPETKSEINSVFGPIISNKPAVVFLDFSLDSIRIEELAWQLIRSMDLKKTSIIGLLNNPDEESDKDELVKRKRTRNLFKKNDEHFLNVFLTEIPFICYKLIDYKNFVFDGMFAKSKNITARPVYATYKNIEISIPAYINCKLTNITKEHIVIEGPAGLKKKDSYAIFSDEIEQLNEKMFVLEDISSKLQRTSHSARYKLKAYFREDYIWDRKEKKKQLEKENKEKNTGQKTYALQEWVEEEMDQYIKEEDFPKIVDAFTHTNETKYLKLLIVQRNIGMLETLDKPLEEYSYIVKFQTIFSNDFEMIKKFRPNVIAIHFESEIKEEDSNSSDQKENEDQVNLEKFSRMVINPDDIKKSYEAEKSQKPQSEDEDEDEDEDEELTPVSATTTTEEEQLDETKETLNPARLLNGITSIKELIEVIKAIPNYEPIIKIFDNTSTSLAWQKVFNYRFILSSNKEPSMDFLNDILKVYEKSKIDVKPHFQDKFISNEDNPFSIYPLSPLSRIEIETNIVITSLSEHEITFICPNKLKLGNVIRLELPIPMLVTVVTPIEDESSNFQENEKKYNGFHFHGIINGIDEIEIAKLRRYVNKLFFTEKILAQKEELKEFKDKNTQAALKKIEDHSKDQGE